MKTKYITLSIIIAALAIFLCTIPASAAGKGWYWFMNLGGAKTADSAATSSDKKSTTDAETAKKEDKTAVTKDDGTVPGPITEKEEE